MPHPRRTGIVSFEKEKQMEGSW